MTEAEKIIIARVHPILASRQTQLQYNLSVLDGGRPYIDARLERFPYEPNASWDGNVNTSAKGRKHRAFLTNYAARVANKLNQYVFDDEVKRNGIDPEFEADATKTRLTVNAVMQDVSRQLSATRWCWMSADRAAASVDAQTGTIRAQSVAEKEARGDRVFWTVWKATDVVDWCFDNAGSLLWLLTDEMLLDNANPFAPSATSRVRTLWQRGGTGVRYFFKSDSDELARSAPFMFSSGEIPFVPCGTISSSPWWFDEAEMIQASLMNLENVHNENLFQMVYPQAVFPAELSASSGGASGDNMEGSDLIRRVGLRYPIFESAETKGVTRFVTPDASGLKSIPDEIQRRKKEFFDVVGMALAVPESRQVASAESKEWDHLDIEAVLAERAAQLEAIERKMIEVSVSLDSTFAVYEPVYAREFDVTDIATDFQALLQLNNILTTPLALREVQYATVHLLEKIAPIPDDRKQEIMDELASAEPTPPPQSPEAFPPAT